MDPNVNPYAAPQSGPEGELLLPGADNATRGARFGAALIDGLILAVLMSPVWYFTGVFERAFSGRQPEFSDQLTMGLVGMVAFVLVQGYPLSKSGQTLGKKAVGIKIVDLDGTKPSLARLLLRSIGPQLIALIPVIGFLVVLADPLFIFGGEKRCLHDMAVGTRVVVA